MIRVYIYRCHSHYDSLTIFGDYIVQSVQAKQHSYLEFLGLAV